MKFVTLNENEFTEIILDLSNSKLDEAIARLNTFVSAGKKIEYIYEELQRQFCTLIKESYSHTSDVNISKKVLLSMSKIIIDYESKIKYCSDKYFAMLSMFNEIADNGSMDINKRIEKLEEAIASGSFKKSAIDMDRINRIQKALKMDSNDRKKLIEKRQEKHKVDDLTNEFLSFTKGEIDYGTN